MPGTGAGFFVILFFVKSYAAMARTRAEHN